MRILRPTTRRTSLNILGCAAAACSYSAAILLLGLPGVLAGLIFLPVVLSLLMRREANPKVRLIDAPIDSRNSLLAWLGRFLGEIGHPTVAVNAEIDGFQELEAVHDRATLEGIQIHVQNVIEAHLTEADVVVSLNDSTFGIALAPQAPHDLETMLNLCTRIQHDVAKPQVVGELPIPISISIGFASSDKLEKPTADSLLQAATIALMEARTKAPGAVRGYSTSMSSKRSNRQSIGKAAVQAFDRGEIFAYFQPQIDVRDGKLSGFEALTRWHHPKRGIISPAEFLPVLENAALMQRLSNTMVKEALQAVTYWDRAGVDVPRIGVNFSTSELRDPHLVDRIAILLDSANVSPNRLVVEVLETVIANQADDEIISNLQALADLGCGIDLDDFGTGYASITNIRRFCVERIKIDRSFVAGLDQDEEQRSMVAAMLTMADRLGVTTLAEGVETKGELMALGDLGCHTAQGFHIARPMPLEETVIWAEDRVQTKMAPVQLQRRAG